MSESILNENLIATFEQSLRQTRNAQNRLMVRLREVETEGDRLRQEIEALDNSAEKTEAAIYSILATMGSKKNKGSRGNNANNDSSNDSQRNQHNDSIDKQRDEMRFEDFTPSVFTPNPQPTWEQRENQNNRYSENRDYQQNNYQDDSLSYINRDQINNNGNNNNNNRNNHNNGNNNNNRTRKVPNVGHNIEPISERFADRTITQACTLLLRESGNPLHVNELYNHLIAGGFGFKGNNPTISIAVSLNRNRRFRKVAPGTFDLVMRDASQAAS